MAIKIETQSEEATSKEPARVLVYDNDALVGEIIVRVEKKRGADGGYYDCVTLEKK